MVTVLDLDVIMSLYNLWDEEILAESAFHPDALFFIDLLDLCLICSFTLVLSNFTAFNICLLLKRCILCSYLFKSCQLRILKTIIVCFYHVSYLVATSKLFTGHADSLLLFVDTNFNYRLIGTKVVVV